MLTLASDVSHHDIYTLRVLVWEMLELWRGKMFERNQFKTLHSPNNYIILDEDVFHANDDLFPGWRWLY